MRVFILTIVVTTLLGALSTIEADDIISASKKLGRGINLGNALEADNEGDWGVTLQAKYFEIIKQAGFNTVRLPIKWSAHAGITPPYAIDPKFAARVDWAVAQATKNNLNILLDFHHYVEMSISPDENLSRLVVIWEQVAARYERAPANVYFELLNEPNGALNEDKWNAVIPPILAAIRKTNPSRPIIVGPSSSNGISALDNLMLPADKNLILTVHFYDPIKFTHQGAQWVSGSDAWKGTSWSGSEEQEAAIRLSLDKAADWASRHNRPLFLGEFGAYEEADMDSRIRWTRYVVQEAEKHGFSWAYWEFCSGFGVFDPKKNEWRPALLAALLGTAK
jgi:endoglucanase